MGSRWVNVISRSINNLVDIPIEIIQREDSGFNRIDQDQKLLTRRVEEREGERKSKIKSKSKIMFYHEGHEVHEGRAELKKLRITTLVCRNFN